MNGSIKFKVNPVSSLGQERVETTWLIRGYEKVWIQQSVS